MPARSDRGRGARADLSAARRGAAGIHPDRFAVVFFDRAEGRPAAFFAEGRAIGDQVRIRRAVRPQVRDGHALAVSVRRDARSEEDHAAAAACSLLEENAVDGMRTKEEILAMIKEYGGK